MAMDLCQHPNTLPTCMSLSTSALTVRMEGIAEWWFSLSHERLPRRNTREYLGDLSTSPRTTSTSGESFKETISDLSLSTNDS